uniref:Glycosyltransferase family 92 protein n=1 Tax=Caenorhabditis japonica TaxID=281687 RepID=A0A8R1DTJ3_CAEJA
MKNLSKNKMIPEVFYYVVILSQLTLTGSELPRAIREAIKHSSNVELQPNHTHFIYMSLWGKRFVRLFVFIGVCFGFLIAVTILAGLTIFDQQHNHIIHDYVARSDDIVVLSTTYYEESKSFPPNTAVILFNSVQVFHLKHSSLNVVAETMQGNVEVPFKIEPVINTIPFFCKWVPYLAIGQVPPDHVLLKLSTNKKDGMETRISPWPAIRIGESRAASPMFDPNTELEFRNQASAMTDCLLQYKESADFIIFPDPDDILVPSLGKNYFEEFTKLSLRTPFQTPRKVVACFSPLFLNERWQLLLTTVEIYSHYGAFMHFYIRSMITDLFTLIKENKNTRISPWPAIRIGESRAASPMFDPNTELEFRNQASAMTDCLLQYKESADFIIFPDPDDILVPSLGKNYFEEFTKAFNMFPTAGAIVYNMTQTTIESSTTPALFSPMSLLSSIKFKGEQKWGKLVVRPERVDSTWIHRSYGIREGYEQKLFSRLPKVSLYYPLIEVCYNRIFYALKDIGTCRGPELCNIPPFPGLRCTNVASDFVTYKSYHNIYIHQLISTDFEDGENGCTL